MDANDCFFAFFAMHAFYIGQEMMAVNKVFQPTGLTKLKLPNDMELIFSCYNT